MTDYKKDIALAEKIAHKVKDAGGRAYFVGGYVRDKLMGTENKDIDIEVHGLPVFTVECILDSFSGRITVGESFGIYGVKGYSLDIALPRKEKQVGRGHRDLSVCVDPFLGLEKAAMRRDLTINAMYEDVLTGEVFDFFGGKEDLKNKCIRHVSDKTFADDPLRSVRAAQFSARFGFYIAPVTVEICKKTDITALAKERVFEEIKKALLKSEKPSLFFEALKEMDKLDFWLPELKALIGIKQNPKFHAEGDAFCHTMMVLDEGAKLKNETSSPLGFMLACLVHDLGKAVSTQEKDGVIHAYGHETSGLPLAKQLLCRLTSEKSLISYALNLAELHMKPYKLAFSEASVKSTNKMFDAAKDKNALIAIAEADNRGKITQDGFVSKKDFLINRLDIYNEYMSRPYVTGKDLIDAGITAGEEIKKLLEYSHKLRIAGIDKKSALRQTLSYIKEIRKNI